MTSTALATSTPSNERRVAASRAGALAGVPRAATVRSVPRMTMGSTMGAPSVGLAACAAAAEAAGAGADAAVARGAGTRLSAVSTAGSTGWPAP